MRLAPITLLLATLCSLLWISRIENLSVRLLDIALHDIFDRRPERKILFLGNSRIFTNDMPYLVHKMADSASAAERYDIHMDANPGETLEEHWKDEGTQRLIAQRDWNTIVIQAESGAHTTSESSQSFMDYGELLVARSRSVAPTALLVGWAYDESAYVGYPPNARKLYHDAIQREHWLLARRTGAELINVGRAWERLRSNRLPFRLTSDGNHPTIQGSYLAALVTYAALSKSSVDVVTYVPRGMTASDADLIKKAVTSL